jgi:hypothetical protein
MTASSAGDAVQFCSAPDVMMLGLIDSVRSVPAVGSAVRVNCIGRPVLSLLSGLTE